MCLLLGPLSVGLGRAALMSCGLADGVAEAASLPSALGGTWVPGGATVRHQCETAAADGAAGPSAPSPLQGVWQEACALPVPPRCFVCTCACTCMQSSCSRAGCWCYVSHSWPDRRVAAALLCSQRVSVSPAVWLCGLALQRWKQQQQQCYASQCPSNPLQLLAFCQHSTVEWWRCSKAGQGMRDR